MALEVSGLSTPLSAGRNGQNTSEQWLRLAKADYRLCREFALRHGARLHRTLRSQRTAWELFGHIHCAILLPDDSSKGLVNDPWHLYYVAGETLFRRTQEERERVNMLLLAESTDDWAELLRQALSDQVFDISCQVTPDYFDTLGDTERTRTGFTFTLEACAPQGLSVKPYQVTGCAETPEGAARDACRAWLLSQGTDIDTLG